MNFYEEKIDAYLTGKLDVSDRIAFENEMSSNVDLKTEVDFQKDIIESIQANRKMQLKNRLNSIEVGGAASSGVSSTVKVAASVITVGLVGAGLYFLSVFSLPPTKEEAVSVPTTPLDQNNLNGTNNSTSDQVVANGSIKNESVSKVDLENVSSTKKSTANQLDNTPVIMNNANVVVPNGELESEDAFKSNKSVEIPSSGIVESSDRKSINTDVSIDDRNKNDFSYKYYSNKLFLFGNFQDQPYNLVEIVDTQKKKQLFLYYNNKYYELKSDQTKVTPLVEVKDSKVIGQLDAVK